MIFGQCGSDDVEMMVDQRGDLSWYCHRCSSYTDIPAEASPDWCFAHSRMEPLVEGCVMCGECLHVYPTPADLVADDNAVRAEMGVRPNDGDPDHIHVCAHCTHDL